MGDSHKKGTGMLIILPRGVNYGLWTDFGCSGLSANISAIEVLLRVVHKEISTIVLRLAPSRLFPYQETAGYGNGGSKQA